EGTTILTSGAASVPLAAAAWHHGSRRASLSVSGTGFMGRVEPTVSGAWGLELATVDGTPLEGSAPELLLRVIPDSAPVVTLPVPGRDTLLPLTLKQSPVIDPRGDHGLTRLHVVGGPPTQHGTGA